MAPKPTGPMIPLWPEGQVPGERPATFGDETKKCNPHTFPMDKCSDISLWNVTVPEMAPYLLARDDEEERRTLTGANSVAMIVAPGGGYNLLAWDKEGTDIAAWLNSIGISAFVLKYRVPGRSWLPFGEAPLMDAQRAMGLVRHKYGQTFSKLGFMGFSAGAHLTGHLNVAWEQRRYPQVDKADLESCRPDASIMVYPWRSVVQPPVHESPEGASALNITKDTPPTMLIQTQDDSVHVENSLFYYLALKQQGNVPSELHVYPKGGHGYGRCTIGTSTRAPTWYEVCTWPDRAQSFLQRNLVGAGYVRMETDTEIVVEQEEQSTMIPGGLDSVQSGTTATATVQANSTAADQSDSEESSVELESSDSHSDSDDEDDSDSDDDDENSNDDSGDDSEEE